MTTTINSSCGSHFLPASQCHSFVDHGVQVVHEEFGIVEGLMTIVHATSGLLLIISNCLYLL